jgi:hypothetical protein
MFIFFGKLLRFIEILYFKFLILPQLHFSLDIKNGFSSRIANMDMNRAVIIAVESKTKSVRNTLNTECIGDDCFDFLIHLQNFRKRGL